MAELAELLKAEAVLGCLSDSQRQALARTAISRSYEKDASVFRAGDCWPYVLYILEGSLRSVLSAPDGRNFIGWTWQDGDVFWSPTIFDGEAVPSTLEAIAATTACVWEGEDVLPVVLQNEKATRALLRRQATIIRQRRQGIYSLAFNPLVSRLAQLLVDRIFVAEQSTVQRDLTLAEMAEMIASSPEVVCRLLYGFQSLGAISISRASITLHDRKALENLVLRD